jgi:hypothetical protein
VGGIVIGITVGDFWMRSGASLCITTFWFGDWNGSWKMRAEGCGVIGFTSR